MELLINLTKRPECGIKKIDAGQYCPGDVIVAKHDGWPWSKRELENPDWVIIRVSITLIEVEALTSPELDYGNIKPVKLRRRWSLDIRKMGIKPNNDITEVKGRSLANLMIDKVTNNAK